MCNRAEEVLSFGGAEPQAPEPCLSVGSDAARTPIECQHG